MILLALALLACDKDLPADDTSPPDTSPALADRDGDGATEDVDCDDSDPSAYPGNVETCDGVDNDCDSLVDNGATDAPTWFPDLDSDGYGDDSGAVQACEAPSGHVSTGGDCDDKQPLFHPGADETCTDPYDYNCDGSVGLVDSDKDGFAACEECDDGNALIFPGADEFCDGVDSDCNGVLDDDYALDAQTWHVDDDGDGYGTSDTLQACAQPAGTADNDADCDDSDASISPAASEIDLDDIDQDCDGYDGGVDTDGDGLEDADEVNTYGSDPTKTDSDGDGLADGDEVLTHGTDPAAADTDGDGWDDGEEIDTYTDPDDSSDHPYTGGWEIDSCRSSITATGSSVGDVAANFSLSDQYGDTVKLHDFCGKAVLLDLSSMWCGVCQAKAPTIASWQSTYGSYGFIVISVHDQNTSRGTPTTSELLAWDSAYGLGAPVVSDGGASVDSLYDPTGKSRPTLVLIEPGGVIHSIGSGSSVTASDIEGILPTAYP